MILSYFHSNSVSEPSQSIEIKSRWPTCSRQGGQHGGGQGGRHGGRQKKWYQRWQQHQHGNRIGWERWSRGWLIGPELFRLKLTRLAHLLSFASLLKPSLTSSALSTQFEISSGLGVWWMRRARDCQREQSDRSLSSGQLLQWLVTTLSILTISELLKIICKNGPQEWITKK